MSIFIVVGAMILLLYIFISTFIFKRKLNIKEKRLHPFSKNRNKMFLILEVIAIFAFAATGFFYINLAEPVSLTGGFVPKLVVVLFFSVEIIRGLELWVFHREEKSYYSQSLGSLMFIGLFLLFYYSEGYLY